MMGKAAYAHDLVIWTCFLNRQDALQTTLVMWRLKCHEGTHNIEHTRKEPPFGILTLMMITILFKDKIIVTDDKVIHA